MIQTRYLVMRYHFIAIQSQMVMSCLQRKDVQGTIMTQKGIQ